MNKLETSYILEPNRKGADLFIVSRSELCMQTWHLTLDRVASGSSSRKRSSKISYQNLEIVLVYKLLRNCEPDKYFPCHYGCISILVMT